jgi:hypothetical protein
MYVLEKSALINMPPQYIYIYIYIYIDIFWHFRQKNFIDNILVIKCYFKDENI